MVPYADRAGANARTHSRLELARCRFNRITCRQFILGVSTCKACSWCHSAFLTGSHRPWLEAESWGTAFEHRYSLRSRTALGTIKRAPTARRGDAVRGGLENQSQRAGSYESGSHYYPDV